MSDNIFKGRPRPMETSVWTGRRQVSSSQLMTASTAPKRRNSPGRSAPQKAVDGAALQARFVGSPQMRTYLYSTGFVPAARRGFHPHRDDSHSGKS